MLGRVALVLLGTAGAAAACGGSDFQAHDAGVAGSGATAGAPDSTTGGTPDQVGGGNAGAPVVEGGAPGEAGAGGVAPLPPSIQIVQVSRTSVLGNVEPTLTLSKLPQAGNSLIVGITCFSDIDNCLIPAEGGVTDNQNNTYLLVKEGASIVSSDTHGSRPYLFIAENIPAPSGML